MGPTLNRAEVVELARTGMVCYQWGYLVYFTSIQCAVYCVLSPVQFITEHLSVED